MTTTQPPALVASRERMRAVLHAALDCVVAIDADGRIIEFNPAAEHCFGYPASEAVGREMTELIVPPALRERHRAGFARYLTGAPPSVLDRRIEIIGMRASGEEFPVDVMPNAGVDRPSRAVCRAVRAIVHARLRERIGRVGPATMGEIETRLALILGLDRSAAVGQRR